MNRRILLHLACLCRNRRQARFYLAGIAREFLPRNLRTLVR